MKKQRKKAQIITVGLLAVFGIGMVLSVIGLSRTVAEIDEVAVAGEPEAVLASVGVESGADINLPVAYFDQKQDACVNLYDKATRKELVTRQFEWTSCGYHHQQIESGLVAYELNEDYSPIGVGGEILSNQGLADMTRWFNGVEGKSKAYSGTLQLKYEAGETVKFTAGSESFYPLDEVDFSVGDKVNSDGHNHLWTLNFAVPFTVMASGEEALEITADDDTFVYLGKNLALDMGGIHEATTGKFIIHENGEVYTVVDGEELAYSGITVTKDEGLAVRIFHADRDAGDGSVFKIGLTGMSLNVVQTQLASGAGGVQVAYNPADPSYVGPLGESMVVGPDGTRGYVVTATILGVAIATCAIFMVIMAHALIKSKMRK